MRGDVQAIFKTTPPKKQVMMFSATMSNDVKVICRKFMRNQFEIFIDNQAKLTLHGLKQYYLKIEEEQKIKKLIDLLDSLHFNQVIVFVKSVDRAQMLDTILRKDNFPSIAIHRNLEQDERIKRYTDFKNFKRERSTMRETTLNTFGTWRIRMIGFGITLGGRTLNKQASM